MAGQQNWRESDDFGEEHDLEDLLTPTDGYFGGEQDSVREGRGRQGGAAQGGRGRGREESRQGTREEEARGRINEATALLDGDHDNWVPDHHAGGRGQDMGGSSARSGWCGGDDTKSEYARAQPTRSSNCAGFADPGSENRQFGSSSQQTRTETRTETVTTSPTTTKTTPTTTTTHESAMAGGDSRCFIDSYHHHHHHYHHHHQHQHQHQQQQLVSPARHAYSDPDEEEAPPAYSPRGDHYQPRRQQYNTFPSAMGDGGSRDDEARGLLSPDDAAASSPETGGRGERRGLLAGATATNQESMGGHRDYDDVEPARWRPAKKKVPLLQSRTFRWLLTTIAVFAIVLGFIATYLNSSPRNVEIPQAPNRPPATSQPILGEPEQPENPNQPQMPPPNTDPTEPPMRYPPFDREIVFPSKSACQAGKVVSAETYPFLTGDAFPLVLMQTMEDENQAPSQGTPVKVHGDVLVRRTSGAPEMVIEVQSNDDTIRVGQQWDSRAQKLVLVAPRKVAWDDQQKQAPCLHVRATISLPKGARLESVKIDVLQMNIQLLDNLDLGVLKTAELSTTAGSVASATTGTDDMDKLVRDGAPSFYRFEARTVNVWTTAGHISGAWALYDYLGFDTNAGTVTVGIEPKPVLATDPRVATLYVHSTSGNVEFWEPVHKAQKLLVQQQQAAGSGQLVPAGSGQTAVEVLPPREYDINVHTTSGDIKGAAAFSYAGKFHSTSGSVAIDLLPLLPAELGMTGVPGDKKTSSLETSSTSGNTAIRLLEPLWWTAATQVYSTSMDAGEAGQPGSPGSPPSQSPGGSASGEPDRGLVVPVGSGPDGLFKVPSGNPAWLTSPAVGAPTISRRQQQEAQAAAMGVPKYLMTLSSRHTTTSASIGVRYPGTWRGDVDVNNMSGKIKTWGATVVDKSEQWPGVNKHVRLRKGDQARGTASGAVVQSMSGKVEFGCGKKR